jgi:hypothetical protein
MDDKNAQIYWIIYKNISVKEKEIVLPFKASNNSRHVSFRHQVKNTIICTS